MRGAADVIRLVDGSRRRDQVVAEASQRGVPAAVTERVITLLAAAGAIIDFPADALRSMPRELRQQLAPVLAVASLAGQDADGGVRLLARRSAATVHVRGRGLIAGLIIDLLIRSGLAAAADVETSWRQDRQPDLIVLVGHPGPAEVAELQRQRRAHLAVGVSEAIAVVGPLVRPGRTACLRCLDHARAERDPAWPLILAQLPADRMDATAGDAVLATAVAAQAAAQAVAFADRSELAAATANGTLELALPDWQWRRRTWRPHQACTCGSWASAAGGRQPASAAGGGQPASAAGGGGRPAQAQPRPDRKQTGDRDDRADRLPHRTAGHHAAADDVEALQGEDHTDDRG
jgi:bacteriocin biosynthesis cyclodehydratase domain-containing protein